MSNKALTLSIVIPVYNEERYIGACLDAIAKQSVAPNEVIIVDNNSTDKTVKIAKRYKFVTVLKEPKQGIVFARNSGFSEARGDIIGRIDADTLLTNDWVLQVINFFKDNADIAAVTGSCYFYDFPMRRAFHALHSFIYYILQRFIAGTHILWGSNMAIRKENWRKIEPHCHRVNGIHEDIDLSLVLHKHKQSIGRVNKLKASVSLRRGNLRISSLNHYLAAWHATYLKNDLYVKTVFILFLEMLTLLAAIFFLPFRALAKLKHLPI
jgi:glycosyltransferase involved in cell wall biosynthesis